MLFSRIYSWIKYKTLPPSVLFLNRLYVERDSKSRRVTSNLGLTFRNSKWSSYARTNINLKNKTDYLYLLSRCVLLFLSLAAITSLGDYYSGNSVTQLHYTFLWFLLDADLYLKVIFSSALLCTGQLLISSLFNTLISSFSSSEVTAPESDLVSRPLTLPKRLHKPVLYAWLQSTSSSSQTLVDILDSTNSTDSLPGLYSKVYSSARLLRLSNLSSYQLVVPVASIFNKSPVSRIGVINSDLNNDLLVPALDYAIFGKSWESRNCYFRELNEWSLHAIHADISSNGNYLEALNGAFYFSSITNSKLSHLITNVSELSTLKHSVETQLASIRWQRWLYKYNLLHRSTLSGTRQINLAKKLINSGFYTSSLTTNNIWASSVFTNDDASTGKIRDLHESLYGTSGSLIQLPILPSSRGFINSSSLENLAFYELSYNWFVQRFYQLNTLPANQVITRPVLRSQYTSLMSQNTGDFNSASSALAIDSSYFSSLASSSLDVQDSKEAPLMHRGSTQENDLYLNYYDSTFLSKSRLELVQNLVRNKSVSAVNFYSPTPLAAYRRPTYL